MKKFFLVCVGTSIIVAMILATIRFWGLGQNHKAFQSDFFSINDQTKNYEELKIIPWEQASFLEKFPNYILWVDVYRAKDETLIARPWADRAIITKNLERQVSPTRPALTELLQTYPSAKFVLNVIDNLENIHNQLLKVIADSKAEKRVLIQSDFPAVLTSIREANPMMVFGSSARDLVKLKIMESLYILPAAPFRGDALILPLTANKHETITNELAGEMKRRKIALILGPLQSKEEINIAKSLGADGYYVSDPLLLH